MTKPQLAALNLGVLITMFLDNARYQRCQLVRAAAEQLHIELCFLPAYSPNLNLIERLWKFVKKQCLYSKYYQDFASFRAAIVTRLIEAHTQHRSVLDSLLTLRFQPFEKVQLVTVSGIDTSGCHQCLSQGSQVRVPHRGKRTCELIQNSPDESFIQRRHVTPLELMFSL